MVSLLTSLSSLLLCTVIIPGALNTAPRFDPTTLMRLVLVPVDASIGSVIYRLRATDDDFDYPLSFALTNVTDAASVVSVETLACTKYNSMCQANVVLRRRLEIGRYYDFRVTVRDTSGAANTIACSLSATNATTPRDTIFPHIPGLITVAEDSKRGTDLEYIVARKNPRFTKPVYLELWGSPLFALRQRLISDEETEGTLFLLGPLDYEKQATHHLNILANDAYAEPGQDSRNIAGLEVVVVVMDVQDMPPLFTVAPPITRLNNTLLPGDIVTRVHAEDGDKGNPRPIRYGLVSEGNPFTPFFNISATNGDIILARPLDEIAAISHVGTPIILTVVAEEVRVNKNEPEAMSSTVQLAFLLGDRGNRPPYFANDNYVARINENAPQGSTLQFSDSYTTEVGDDDVGENGAFALTLLGNNGTFEIAPSVGEQHVSFFISVRDNALLDYETTKTVQFQIVAQELGPGNISTSVDVLVFLNDVNDNPPVFVQEQYTASLPENVTAGVQVVRVEATDKDTGVFGRIRYTQILGHLNTSLSLDAETGAVTIATNEHGFDCETMLEHRFYVEATDEDGIGNRATVPLIIQLIDVNDETPQFERSLFEFVLSPSRRNFTFPAFLKATDRDVTAPNNIVRYELTHGNYENVFALNEITGELTLRESLVGKVATTDVYVLNARAYDLGIPHLSSTCQINVYPPEVRTRTVVFIVPGRNPDRQQTEETLATITGGRVIVQEIRPYTGDNDGLVGVTDVTAGDTSAERSIVTASVSYGKNSVIDITQLQNKLGQNRSTSNNSGGSSTTQTHGQINETNVPYRAESNFLFWFLIFLTFLIIVALIILVLCCICAGCPLYMPPKKRVVRINSTDDDVHLVVKEKTLGLGVENNNRPVRKEAWSADVVTNTRTHPTHWQFIQDADMKKQAMNGRAGMATSSAGVLRTHHDYNDENYHYHHHHHHQHHNGGPHIIYNRELQQRSTYHNHRHVDEDDLDGSDSLRQHEMDRGSDRPFQRRHQRNDTTRVDEDNLRRSFRRQQAVNRDRDLNDNEFGVVPDEDNDRDQLFIREGNTEILRLMTRGRAENENEQRQRPVTLVQGPTLPQPPPTLPQYILVDSGKHLLMERFIEQQLQEQQQKQQRSHHSSNSNLSTSLIADPKQQQLSSQELLLETSLRQQNELLRQILLEKEHLDEQKREIHLETQSLPPGVVHSIPIGTQTECTAGTQTENDIPWHLMRPPKRQARSDNDDDDDDDDSINDNNDLYVYVINNSRRRLPTVMRRRRRRGQNTKRNAIRIRHQIKTPILEENESSPLEDKKQTRLDYNETKTSLMRRKRNQKTNDGDGENDNEDYRTNVMTSMSIQSDTDEDELYYKIKANKLAAIFSDDSNGFEEEEGVKESIKDVKQQQPEPESSSSKKPTGPDRKKIIDVSKCVPRYMQWYTKTTENKGQNRKKDETKEEQRKSKKLSKSLLADTRSTSIKKVYPIESKMKEISDGELLHRPLVQHSAYRYEHPKATAPVGVPVPEPTLHTTSPPQQQPQQPHQISVQPPDKPPRANTKKQPQQLNVPGPDDDYDSGIAIIHATKQNKQNRMTEKKSIFTIAYDDMQTKQLRPDSSTPPY